MTDGELIEFMWNLFWGLVSDGDVPSNDEWDLLIEELTEREILDGDLPV